MKPSADLTVEGIKHILDLSADSHLHRRAGAKFASSELAMSCASNDCFGAYSIFASATVPVLPPRVDVIRSQESRSKLVISIMQDTLKGSGR